MPTEPFFFDASEITPRRLAAGRSKRRAVSQRPTRGCEDCGLHLGCKSPCMDPFGENRLGIMVAGEQPGKDEDIEGRQFVGRSGRLLNKLLRRADLDMDRDCILTNAVQCFSEEKPGPPHKQCCYHRLDRQIEEHKPELIFCFGAEAISAVTGRPLSISRIRGHVLPSRRYGCWLVPMFHPAYLLRQGENDGNGELSRLVCADITRGLVYLDQDVSQRFIDEDRGNHWVTDEDDAIEILDEFAKCGSPVSFDYETTGLDPFAPDAAVLLMGLSINRDEGWSLSVPRPPGSRLLSAIRQFLTSPVPKIAYNAQFEMLWSKQVFGVWPANVVDDPMLTAHVLDERRRTKSLAWQSFVYFDTDYKDQFGRPRDVRADAATARYNCLDARYTVALHEVQAEELDDILLRGKRMLTGAVPALCDMSRQGIRLDREGLLQAKQRAQSEIRDVEATLLSSEAVKHTERRTGRMFSFSESDLRCLFYKVLRLRQTDKTSVKELPSISVEVLQKVVEQSDDRRAAECVQLLARRSEWQKLLSTYISPFLDRLVDSDLLHPSILLHTTRTYRSSSENPNIQNIPIHGEYSDIVRRCIVPKLDAFVEVDYSGMEVRVIAAVSGDRTLIDQLERGVDVHRMWASLLFDRLANEITSQERFATKNQWVFPLFYGSTWKRACFPPLSLSHGRARDAYDEFWDQYRDVKHWQQEVIDWYERYGYVKLVSGFRRRAPLTPTQIGNTPIQGPAFHVLLEKLEPIRVGLSEFESHMVAESHDNILFDVKLDEVEDLLDICNPILLRQPDWLPYEVPFEVDWAMGETWADMEEL